MPVDTCMGHVGEIGTSLIIPVEVRGSRSGAGSLVVGEIGGVRIGGNVQQYYIGAFVSAQYLDYGQEIRWSRRLRGEAFPP